jgi:AcrB/AcrD/AcrF family
MAAGAFAVRADNRRQAFETGAYGHGRLYDVISKSRPLCSLPGLKGCQRLCAPIAPLEALCGFIPMALGTAPARVQKPLSTFVIGGLLVSTPFTFYVLPLIYNRQRRTTSATPRTSPSESRFSDAG